MKTINASDFKAKCLAILDEVKQSGEVVIILKRGKPVAQLVPAIMGEDAYPQKSLFGTVQIKGDVLAPVIDSTSWEVEGRNST
jgi:prevent-host-death family protein